MIPLIKPFTVLYDIINLHPSFSTAYLMYIYLYAWLYPHQYAVYIFICVYP